MEELKREIRVLQLTLNDLMTAYAQSLANQNSLRIELQELTQENKELNELLECKDEENK
ncbi:hypothetical protein [Dolosigranulum pigrum]|jgi:hypothetical protein